MENKKELPRRPDNYVRNNGQQNRSNTDGGAPREGQRPVNREGHSRDYQNKDYQNRDGAPREGAPREAQNREGAVKEPFQRENRPREGFGRQSHYNSNQSRHIRTKVEETIDDIKGDISRIEKEIELEIKEIKSLKLGL